jgi:hypothetical protein
MAKLFLDRDLTYGEAGRIWHEAPDHVRDCEPPLLIEIWPISTPDHCPDGERRKILTDLFEKCPSLAACLHFEHVCEVHSRGGKGVLLALIGGGHLTPGSFKRMWPSDPDLQKMLEDLPQTLVRIAAAKAA